MSEIKKRKEELSFKFLEEFHKKNKENESKDKDIETIIKHIIEEDIDEIKKPVGPLEKLMFPDEIVEKLRKGITSYSKNR